MIKSCLISLLLLNYVSGHSINTVDGSASCKYLALKNGETVLFKKDSGNLEHTTMGLVTDQASTSPKFATNFAVQSASEFIVLMFTRKHYATSQTDADYKIGIGSNNNEFSYFFQSSFSASYENFQSYDLKNSSQVLSSDKYEKFYITINDGTLKYGKHCVQEPIVNSNSLGFNSPDIVQIGFESKSEHGAKVYYDCPATFADCLSGAA